MRTKAIIVATCVGTILTATTAGALLVPKKARQIKGEFVPSYVPCSAPTGALGPPLLLPACPAYPNSDACVFGADASGKYQLSATRSRIDGSDDIKSSAKATGLSGCDGHVLVLAVDTRLTTDACTQPDCTAESFTFAAGSCTVALGKCDIRSTIDSYYGFPLFLLGRGYDVELGEICLFDTTTSSMLACGGIRLGTPSFTGISPTPVPPKRIFLTSVAYDGNLGGLAGADALCQARASAGSLSGTFKAWLSSASVSAASRLTHHAGAYEMPGGIKVADSWTDLTDGTLDAPIDRDETGTQIPGANHVWTGSNASGAILGNTCGSWSVLASGHYGLSDSSSATWSDSFVDACDVNMNRLYCLEQ